MPLSTWTQSSTYRPCKKCQNIAWGFTQTEPPKEQLILYTVSPQRPFGLGGGMGSPFQPTKCPLFVPIPDILIHAEPMYYADFVTPYFENFC